MRTARGTGKAVALMLALVSAACSGGDNAGAESGPDSTTQATDVCHAFSGVDTACPIASPTRCFPLCAVGGCFCRATPQGPRWACVTDLSCQPDCAPLDEACGAVPVGGDDASDASGETDTQNEGSPSDTGQGAESGIETDAGDAADSAGIE